MNKISNKASIILESLWIIIALLSLSLAVQNTLTQNWNNAKMFYIFVPIAFLMYLLRRNLRKKHQNKNIND